IYTTAYTLPFFLTILNFLYRYWATKSPVKILLFSSKYFIGSLLTFGLIAGIAWYMTAFFVCSGDVNEPGTIALRDALREQTNLTIYDGWIVMDHWRNDTFQLKPFLVIIYADIVMSFTFVTASALAVMTFHHIHVNSMVSEWQRKVQRTVLIALCAQTFVPLLCVYIPYTNNLNTPFLRIRGIVGMERHTASLISCFPLWDAIVITLLMRDYREGFMSMFCASTQVKSAVSSQMNSVSVPSIANSQLEPTVI
ncbi:hypothetical protein PENTCL1PPCAC_25402, partial [Pristionchus entomophagus]